jgi:hypothetical protein
METKQQYIESLFCAIISKLDTNNEKKIKLYKNLCYAINSEGFNISFSEINFDKRHSIYDPIISEYNNFFENKNPFGRNFELIRKIGDGSFGVVFEVKSLLDNHKYAVKKTVPKG